MFTRRLAQTSALTGLTAAVGSVASAGTDSDWYRNLRKPAFQPPAVVFPIAWTALYASIAGTSASVLDRHERDGQQREAAAFGRALLANLALNAGWTWTFFRAHQLELATLNAGVLALSSADLARRAGRAEPRYGWALAPYAGWCGFATLLSGTIQQMNRTG